MFYKPLSYSFLSLQNKSYFGQQNFSTAVFPKFTETNKNKNLDKNPWTKVRKHTSALGADLGSPGSFIPISKLSLTAGRRLSFHPTFIPQGFCFLLWTQVSLALSCCLFSFFLPTPALFLCIIYRPTLYQGLHSYHTGLGFRMVNSNQRIISILQRQLLISTWKNTTNCRVLDISTKTNMKSQETMPPSDTINPLY